MQIESVSNVVSGSGATATIPAPSGLQVGDLLVFRVACTGNKGISIDNGATQIRNDNSDGVHRSYVGYKIATATEVSNGIPYTLNGSASSVGTAYRITGFNTDTPISGSSKGYIPNETSFDFNIGLTPTYPDSLLFIFNTSRYSASGSFNTFAIANDNPTWTIDQVGSNLGSDDMGYASVSAPRTEDTATGNVSYNADDDCRAQAQFIIVNAPPPPVEPTVTTQAVSDILSKSATGNGNVTDDGGATVIERGTVYSTSPNPTIADNKTTSDGTIGAFTTNITGLTENTTYYVRAFATNSVGTSYGDEVEFTTFDKAPVINSVSPNVSLLDVATSITILGEDFRSGLTVEVDGETCTSIVVVDENTITCDVPVGTVAKESTLVVKNDPRGIALSFDGVDDVVNITSPVMPLGRNFTYSAWIKSPRKGSGTHNGIITRSGASSAASRIYIRGMTGEVTVALRGTGDAGTVATNSGVVNLFDNKYHFVVATISEIDASNINLKIYVDGLLIANSDVARSGTFGDASTVLALGSGTDWMLGIIDEPRIWSQVLTDDEIANLYYKGIVLRNGLMAEWLFDEGSGTTALDTSGNGNDGTISGAEYVGNPPTQDEIEFFYIDEVSPTPQPASVTATFSVKGVGILR